MTDRKLDQRISDWLEAEAPKQVPDRVLRVAFERTRKTGQQLGWRVLLGRLRMPRSVPALAGAVIVLVVGVVAVGVYFNGQNIGVGPSPTPSLSLSPSPSPSPSHMSSPSPSPTPGRPSDAPATFDGVHAWPDNRGGNPPGLYSWDVSRRCERDPCLFGRIHRHRNVDQDDNVEIAISMPSEATPGEAVTVAGHTGTYYRFEGLHETWRVDIQGTTIEIGLEAQPGASQADLDEAHAIIDSMRTEPWDNELGFRIVFRIETDYWDSPY